MAGLKKASKRATSGPLVSITDAVVLLGDFPALSGASLEVDEGEVVHLRGGNGAGKSTLINLCAGLVSAHSGTAIINGFDTKVVRDRRQLRKTVGVLAHDLGLYDELSVRENLNFWGRIGRSEIDSIPAVLKRLAVPERLNDVPVGGLSAGQKRRVSLARLLVQRPTLWLLDEPYSGLDIDGVEIVDSLIAEAVSVGATVLFTSHDFSHACTISDRSVEVVGGSIVENRTMPAPIMGGA